MYGVRQRIPSCKGESRMELLSNANTFWIFFFFFSPLIYSVFIVSRLWSVRSRQTWRIGSRGDTERDEKEGQMVTKKEGKIEQRTATCMHAWTQLRIIERLHGVYYLYPTVLPLCALCMPFVRVHVWTVYYFILRRDRIIVMISIYVTIQQVSAHTIRSNILYYYRYSFRVAAEKYPLDIQ